MNKQINAFFTALSFYTRIPCCKLAKYEAEDVSISIKFLPLIGIVVGLVGGGVFFLSKTIFSLEVSIVLTLVSMLLITGAFHEDGFADSLDGFGGGYKKEDVIRIMKDSSIGSYGTIGLIFLFALKFFLLRDVELHYFLPILLAGQSLSRLIGISFVNTHDYVTNNENSKSSDYCKRISIKGTNFAIACAVLPLFWLPLKYWTFIIPMFIVRMFYGAYLTKRLNGYTGDSLGFIQQLSEIVFYLCAAAL